MRDPNSGLTYRVRPRRRSDALDFLLFHGLSGDEDVMWILDSALPEGGLVAAPRAPFALEDGGYSWVEKGGEGPPELARFASSEETIERWFDGLQEAHGLDPARAVLVGFSQGAGLAFAVAEGGRVRPAALVALAGFLPAGSYRRVAELPIFWGHGTRDETVPIERARADIARLEDLGAEVQPCEADVGHKVGVECMRGLKSWLADTVTPRLR